MKDKDKRQHGHLLREQVAEASGLPRDVVFGAPILTMTGQTQLRLENYRGILEYTQELIRVQTKDCQIRVAGTGLQIQYYTGDEMKIIGKVTGIEFV